VWAEVLLALRASEVKIVLARGLASATLVTKRVNTGPDPEIRT
jgi:hypothetical protein